MLVFVLRRLGALLLVLFCVVTITFLMMRLAPGGPFTRERKIPENIERELLKRYNLDGPVYQQLGSYLWNLLRHGDLGLSMKYRSRSVNEILAQTLPVSALLGTIAFAVAALAGVWLGTFAAVRRDTTLDTGAMLAALFAISVPTFVTGPLAVLFLAVLLPVFPVGGWETVGSVILPSLVLAAPYVAYVARLMRSSMLETLEQDFIRTARAKGLPESRVVYRHALKVAVLPVISFLGPLAANLLTGSLVVERIFSVPGMGGFFVNSILNRDYFLIGGVVIVYCTLLVVMNLLVDVAYTLLDPRVKLY